MAENFLDKIKQTQDQQAQRELADSRVNSITDSSKSVADAVNSGTAKTTQEINKGSDKVASEVQKVQSVLESGQDSVAQAINNLMLATVLTKDPRLAEAADNVAKLLNSIADASDKFGSSSLNLLPVANKELAKTITELAKSVQEQKEEDLSPQFDRVVEALGNLKLEAPVVNIPESEIELNIQPIVDAINELKSSIKPTKIDIPKIDLTAVIDGLNAVQNTIGGLSFPVPNYVLPFKDYSGKATQKTVPTTDERLFERVTNTDGASTAFTNFSAVTDKKNYVRGYSIANTSATNAYVDFRNGTGGSVLWTVPIPANGGANVMLDEPIFWTSANTALAFDVSSALTTVYISITGHQS